MRTLTGFTVVLLGLAIFAALIYGGYYAVEALWAHYMALEFVVRIVLLSSMGSILVAAIVVGSAIRTSAKFTVTASIAAEKLALYRKLIEISLGTESTAVKLADLKADVVLLAGGNVLEVFEKIIAATSGNHGANHELDGLYSQLVKSIRQDLGHKTVVGIPRTWYAMDAIDEVERDARQVS